MAAAILFTGYTFGMDPVSASAAQTPTIGSGFLELLHLAGQVAFQWLPATIIVLGNTNNPPQGVGYVPVSATGPTTAPEAANYLHVTADPGVYAGLVRDWEIWTALSLFISLLLAALVIYCVIRILQIRKHENSKWEAAQQPAESVTMSPALVRWKRIVGEIGSETEQNWRLAILEADIMLGELLDSLGYKGETMADKMRSVDRANFNTIDLAWEAHRARNQIAHEGLQQPLAAREARRIIGLYERIFREFRFIG